MCWYCLKRFCSLLIYYKDQDLPRVNKSLALMLVEEAVIIPETISVFNHPSTKVFRVFITSIHYFSLKHQTKYVYHFP